MVTAKKGASGLNASALPSDPSGMDRGLQDYSCSSINQTRFKFKAKTSHPDSWEWRSHRGGRWGICRSTRRVALACCLLLFRVVRKSLWTSSTFGNLLAPFGWNVSSLELISIMSTWFLDLEGGKSSEISTGTSGWFWSWSVGAAALVYSISEVFLSNISTWKWKLPSYLNCKKCSCPRE